MNVSKHSWLIVWLVLERWFHPTADLFLPLVCETNPIKFYFVYTSICMHMCMRKWMREREREKCLFAVWIIVIIIVISPCHVCYVILGSHCFSVLCIFHDSFRQVLHSILCYYIDFVHFFWYKSDRYIAMVSQTI